MSCGNPTAWQGPQRSWVAFVTVVEGSESRIFPRATSREREREGSELVWSNEKGLGNILGGREL